MASNQSCAAAIELIGGSGSAAGVAQDSLNGGILEACSNYTDLLLPQPLASDINVCSIDVSYDIQTATSQFALQVDGCALKGYDTLQASLRSACKGIHGSLYCDMRFNITASMDSLLDGASGHLGQGMAPLAGSVIQATSCLGVCLPAECLDDVALYLESHPLLSAPPTEETTDAFPMEVQLECDDNSQYKLSGNGVSFVVNMEDKAVMGENTGASSSPPSSAPHSTSLENLKPDEISKADGGSDFPATAANSTTDRSHNIIWILMIISSVLPFLSP